ncbi:hypothetical protein TanjilG_13834 [Lupinus angustifolius]|uniref:DUF3511 domain-containing protein n=1 Tax=Lupinus angustifolius TaxID=3871 RepID=A0A1J7HRU5_LUPAN|nr:PREDICTED: uncharacterized protein LOC109342552 [Lupinus angustifolius]OIW15528.1 hypothetical protein TanjilG_13834 [Lupinus angustifolius]
MEDHNRSRSYGNDQMMQIDNYYGASKPYDIRSYSASHAQTQMGPSDLKLKKGKSMSKSWSSLADPEFQRKKRIASYKMYSVEGKVKGTLRKSFKWLKVKYTQMVYDWW